MNRLLTHFFRGQLVKIGHGARDLHYIRRLVALAAKRDGSEIGTVSLGEQAVKRDFLRRLAQVFRLLKSDIARE